MHRQALVEMLEVSIRFRGDTCAVSKVFEEAAHLCDGEIALQETKDNTFVETDIMSGFKALFDERFAFIYLNKVRHIQILSRIFNDESICRRCGKCGGI